jgi:hypothetical protein
MRSDPMLETALGEIRALMEAEHFSNAVYLVRRSAAFFGPDVLSLELVLLYAPPLPDTEGKRLRQELVRAFNLGSIDHFNSTNSKISNHLRLKRVQMHTEAVASIESFWAAETVEESLPALFNPSIKRKQKATWINSDEIDAAKAKLNIADVGPDMNPLIAKVQDALGTGKPEEAEALIETFAANAWLTPVDFHTLQSGIKPEAKVPVSVARWHLAQGFYRGQRKFFQTAAWAFESPAQLEWLEQRLDAYADKLRKLRPTIKAQQTEEQKNAALRLSRVERRLRKAGLIIESAKPNHPKEEV